MSSPSPHIPIENALNGLFDSLNLLANTSNKLPNDTHDWGLSDQNAVEAVSDEFQKLDQFIKNEIASNYSTPELIEQILHVSNIVGQIAHLLTVLNSTFTRT